MPRMERTSTNNDDGDSSSTNRPRNLLVTDATQPYKYTFLQYGKPATVTVGQTAEEETWPGGALWDIGVLLSHVFVALAPGCALPGNQPNALPSRLLSAFPQSLKDSTVLELGCGVGLTGIVAAAALGTHITILTDLKVVVDNVTEPNVVQNTTLPSTSSNNNHPQHRFRITTAGKRGRVVAMPLCWGVQEDQAAVQKALVELGVPPSQKTEIKRKKGRGKNAGSSAVIKDPTKPDIIIIGDVAYQHKPGAPSHFDVLLSTVLHFLGPQTLVVFGTRLRMPASQDLLDMFRTHMNEAIEPVPADEIDHAFAKFKHQITVHVLKKKEI